MCICALRIQAKNEWRCIMIILIFFWELLILVCDGQLPVATLSIHVNSWKLHKQRFDSSSFMHARNGVHKVSSKLLFAFSPFCKDMTQPPPDVSTRRKNGEVDERSFHPIPAGAKHYDQRNGLSKTWGEQKWSEVVVGVGCPVGS